MYSALEVCAGVLSDHGGLLWLHGRYAGIEVNARKHAFGTGLGFVYYPHNENIVSQHYNMEDGRRTGGYKIMLQIGLA